MKARIKLNLPNNVNKALSDEINKQILEHDSSFSVDSDAAVLWTLHTVFGFGKKRLRRFWEACYSEHQNVREYYMADSSEETAWICRSKLKEIGVDIEKWYKEINH